MYITNLKYNYYQNKQNLSFFPKTVCFQPVWKLLADMQPEQIVDLVDFTYM